jgi:hypothetical protein
MPLYFLRIVLIFKRSRSGMASSTRVSVNYRYSVPRLSSFSSSNCGLSLRWVDLGL